MKNITNPESRKRLFLRLSTGARELILSKWKILLLLAYLLLIPYVWSKRTVILTPIGGVPILHQFLATIISILIIMFGALGLFKLIILFGTPFRHRAIQQSLRRIGLVNHFGNSPLFLRRSKDRMKPGITILEFYANGIPTVKWEAKQSELESSLNRRIVKFAEGKNRERILLFTIPGDYDLPRSILWKNEYISNENFELVLGESPLGQETINLAKIPHSLLGGSTNSGKSTLLKLLLMQCVIKGAAVVIIDMKGGVDFHSAWSDFCLILTDEAVIPDELTALVDELERRKTLLSNSGFSTIWEYNKATGKNLPRIILACDEIAELLDKTGLDKPGKERMAQIEAKLSKIARQGRAMSINLIISTQRPDANVIPGQLKSNIDCRICGRADKILSQIILDNTDAADKIPKDAQGRFLTNDGILFQSYLFDEKTAFGGASETVQ